MCKALGIVLVFLALGVFSYKTVKVKTRHLINLKEFKRALVFIKNELSFSMPEVSVLCKMVSEKTHGEISRLFYDMGKTLASDNNTDIFAAWCENTNEKNLFCDAANREVLNFIQNFGRKTLDIELENIKATEIILEQLIQEEKDKYGKEKRLIYTLAASIGAVIVILGI